MRDGVGHQAWFLRKSFTLLTLNMPAKQNILISFFSELDLDTCKLLLSSFCIKPTLLNLAPKPLVTSPVDPHRHISPESHLPEDSCVQAQLTSTFYVFENAAPSLWNALFFVFPLSNLLKPRVRVGSWDVALPECPDPSCVSPAHGQLPESTLVVLYRDV